jgi:crotonobetainyl-CoA:carnitine CoA-transferase CaiB-like acyl-CoA transferase
VARGASLVGQETEGVLKEFGYSAEEIANLAADGVIGLG